MLKPKPIEQVKTVPEPVKGKGVPTPTRAEQEAARMRPLVPNDRKEAARQARIARNNERERARSGLAAGDERFLPTRDRGPQKRYIRDYVDARYSFGELLIPMVLLMFFTLFIPSDLTLATYLVFGMWTVLLVCIVDGTLLTRRLRRKLAAKYGAEKVERIGMYAAMRAMQLRWIRLPKPQVKRGQFPV